MIDVDKLKAFVAGQVGEQIAIRREDLLELCRELELGNAARVRERHQTMPEALAA